MQASTSFVARVLILTIAGACAPQPPGPAPGGEEHGAAVEPLTPASRVDSVVAADGVPVVYETRGAGETAVVFVHCWACNRQFWREQVEPVAAAGYRVVTLDLPGHGDSGAGRAEWSQGALGADVQAVVEELALGRVVLVGHSMGGPVAVEAASRMPGRVEGIVCVDTLHNAEFEWPEGMAESIAGGLEQDYRGALGSFVPQLFKAGADPALVAWVIGQAVETSDAAATTALMRNMPNWDAAARVAAAGVPIRCINAAAEGEQGFPTAVEINRKYADFEAVLMEGVGHYPQLERPEEFNEKLLAELDELLPRQG